MRRLLEIAIGVAVLALPAWGTLGQRTDSVQADQQRMAGEIKSQQFAGYTVHEISQADGRVVREYVSPAGVVFGVVWDGPTMPDLAQLLGSYFDQLQKALPAGPQRRGPLYIRSGALVVVSGGHMRSFHGTAYLTNLIPAGLTEAVLR